MKSSTTASLLKNQQADKSEKFHTLKTSIKTQKTTFFPVKFTRKKGGYSSLYDKLTRTF